jgi:hypothetical protein
VGVREREDVHVQKAAYVNISLKRKIACTRHSICVAGHEEPDEETCSCSPSNLTCLINILKMESEH